MLTEKLEINIEDLTSIYMCFIQWL